MKSINKCFSTFNVLKRDNTNACFVKKKETWNKRKFCQFNKKNCLRLHNIIKLKYSCYWDHDRKLIILSKNQEKRRMIGITFRKNIFAHLEDYYCWEFWNIYLKIKTIEKSSAAYICSMLDYRKVLVDYLIVSSLMKIGYSVQRFRLFDETSAAPDFLCWDKKMFMVQFCGIIVITTPFSSGSCRLISVLLTKLKPISLKIAVIINSVSLFFLVDNGFSANCPLFSQKYFKKKKRIL